MTRAAKSMGERISLYRRRKGLSQSILAAMIGRSESWLSQVERGVRAIDNLRIISRIAEVLEVPIADPEGMTGPDLVTFINDVLFARLKNLSIVGVDVHRARVVRSVFEDAYNYMKSGYLLRQMVNKINDVDFNNLVEKMTLPWPLTPSFSVLRERYHD